MLETVFRTFRTYARCLAFVFFLYPTCYVLVSNVFICVLKSDMGVLFEFLNPQWISILCVLTLLSLF